MSQPKPVVKKGKQVPVVQEKRRVQIVEQHKSSNATSRKEIIGSRQRRSKEEQIEIGYKIACLKTYNYRVVAKRFGVSIRTARRWHEAYRNRPK